MGLKSRKSGNLGPKRHRFGALEAFFLTQSTTKNDAVLNELKITYPKQRCFGMFKKENIYKTKTMLFWFL